MSWKLAETPKKMRCSFSLTVVIQLDKQKLKNSQNICSNSIVGNKQSGNFSLSSTIRNLVAEPHPFQRCIEFLYTSIPNEIHFSSRCKFFSFFFSGSWNRLFTSEQRQRQEKRIQKCWKNQADRDQPNERENSTHNLRAFHFFIYIFTLNNSQNNGKFSFLIRGKGEKKVENIWHDEFKQHHVQPYRCIL